RARLGVAAMPVVGDGGACVAVVLEGDEGTRRGTVDDREPSLGHRADDTRGPMPGPLSRGSLRPVEPARDEAQVAYEGLVSQLATLAGAQDRRRMHGAGHEGRVRQVERLAPVAHDRQVRATERAQRGGAE